MDRIGIERLCTFGLPPVEFVRLAADLKCRYIAIGLVPVPYNPHGYPNWSLRDDRALRREMLAALQDCNVSISLYDGFGVRPGIDVSEYAADFDAINELGVKRINVASLDRDPSRNWDQIAKLVTMADALGMETLIEIGPGRVANLAAALATIRHVGKPSFRLLIDTMHFFRSGAGLADIAALDPNMIGYVQLNDVPLISKHATYMDEALYERMVPGTGELPMLDLLAALPRNVILGLEVPQRSLAEAGLGPHARVGRCVDATRKLLQQLAARTATG